MTGVFGTSLADYGGTIPRLLDHAARRNPGGIWLRTDDVLDDLMEVLARGLPPRDPPPAPPVSSGP